jgi:hypothetical protein
MDNADRPGAATTFAVLLFLLLLYALAAEMDCASERGMEQDLSAHDLECRSREAAAGATPDGHICLVGEHLAPASRPADRCPPYGP